MGSIAALAVTVIVIAAIVAIVLVALRAMGLTVPPWFWHVVGIVLVAIVAAAAVWFIAGLWSHSP